MQQLRLKADGRIVQLIDGRETPLVPDTDIVVSDEMSATPPVRDLRLRVKMTQAELAASMVANVKHAPLVMFRSSPDFSCESFQRTSEPEPHSHFYFARVLSSPSAADLKFYRVALQAR